MAELFPGTEILGEANLGVLFVVLVWRAALHVGLGSFKRVLHALYAGVVPILALTTVPSDQAKRRVPLAFRKPDFPPFRPELVDQVAILHDLGPAIDSSKLPIALEGHEH